MTTIQFRHTAAFARVAVVTALCMGASPLAPLVQAQTAATAAVPKPAAQPAAQADPTVDGGWPKAFTTNAGAALVVYQPQISSWADQRHLVMYSAVSYQAKGAPATAYGTIKVEANSNVSVDARLVSFSDFVITQSNFPGLQKDQIRDLLAEITESIPLQQRVLGLDRVLASVPGTQQAAEAVLLAQIPQTARVARSTPAPAVVYQGQPEFQPIEKTTVSRAVNTDKDIFKVGDLYYMCFQGVWFMAKSPTGPWEVTGTIPAQVYQIPASPPSYPVTYVTVQESNNDAVVFATAVAFTGLMVAWGCAVWGTGYYYPPYVHYGLHPVYYPHYPTYGYAAAYHPWTGAYGRGAVAYGPYGGAGVGAKYNPSTGVYSRGVAAYGPYGGAKAGQAYNSRTGTYARGAMTYGPYGAQGAAQAYNPRTGAYGETRQGSNVYGNWGSTTVQRGDDWAQTAHSTNYRTGSTTAAGRTSEGGAAVTRSGAAGNTTVAKSGSGEMYAGHDGNVYKKSGDGYQKYENGGWNTVQPPTTEQKQQAKTQAQQTGTQARTQASTSGWSGQTASQVQRDASARTTGTQRTQAYSGVKSGSAKASSYKPSGGATRGAGGTRRR